MPRARARRDGRGGGGPQRGGLRDLALFFTRRGPNKGKGNAVRRSRRDGVERYPDGCDLSARDGPVRLILVPWGAGGQKQTRRNDLE